jgi:hypothetical protein
VSNLTRQNTGKKHPSSFFLSFFRTFFPHRFYEFCSASTVRLALSKRQSTQPNSLLSASTSFLVLEHRNACDGAKMLNLLQVRVEFRAEAKGGLLFRES